MDCKIFKSSIKVKIVGVLFSFFLLLPSILCAQNSTTKEFATYKGNVKDVNGENLTGVSVFIKGTTLGTVTDLNGNFTLKVPKKPKQQLGFSFIGLEGKVIQVPEDESFLYIRMRENSQALDEVVATGYYTRKQSSYTGAANTYSREQLQSISTHNVMSTLSVLDPSFKLTDNVTMGSNPNTVPDFTIRGSGSIQSDYANAPNMPTFILDGFEVTSTKVFDLDPNRVESITILKDASATAIYGSRAANGVVVIETKTPKMGALRVSYNLGLDFTVADLSSYNLMNASEKLEYEYKAGLYINANGNISDTERLMELYNQKNKWVASGIDVDWIAKPVRSVAVSQKHSLYVEGGDTQLRYSLGVNYSTILGAMKLSSRDNYGIESKLQYRKGKVRFLNDLTFMHVMSQNSPYGNFSTYAYLNPYYTPYNNEGKVQKILFQPTATTGGSIVTNPMYDATITTKDQLAYDEFNNNFSFEWDVMAGMKWKTNFSINKKNQTSDVFLPASHTSFVNSDVKGSYTKGLTQMLTLDANSILSYLKVINKHAFNFAGIWNIRQSTSDFNQTMVQDFPNDNMNDISMGTKYPDGASPVGSYLITRLVGFAGNMNYAYDEKYLLDLSLRTDGSSMFGSKQRFGTFGSVGVGWNLQKEDFLKDCKSINLLKIRGSIGTTGGTNFYPFQAMQMYTYKDPMLSDITYNGYIGAVLKAYGNENLKWQTTVKKNVGVDYSFFNNRLSGYVNFYDDVSQSLLIDVLIAPSTGFTSYKDNLGEVNNRGMELNVKGTIIKKKDWQIDLFASTVNNKNKLMKLNDNLAAYNQEQDATQAGVAPPLSVNKPVVRYEEGRSVNTIWANESLGIDPQTGEEIFVTKEGKKTNVWSTENYKPMGCTDPKFYGTFGSMIMYKNWQMNAYFMYSCGGDIYNQTLVDKVENVNPQNNADKRVLYDRWQKPGDVAQYKAITNQTTTMPTSRFIEKNNFLSLSSLNISYRVPEVKLKQYGIEQMKIAAIGNELFRASTVKTERGIDYPFARTYSISLQVTF